MNFRKELAKELGLGVIAENTMLDNYVKACEAIAIRYHKSKVEKLNIPVVVNHVCPDPTHHAMEIGLMDKCSTCGATE